MNTPEDNFRELMKLFPDAITETLDEHGQVVRAVDAEVLRQETGAEILNDNEHPAACAGAVSRDGRDSGRN